MSFTIPAMLCHKKAKGADGKTRKVAGPPDAPKLVGYYTKGARPNWARLNEYHDWKDHVRKHVQAALPAPTKDRPVRVDVHCYFASGTHSDPENVRKGIVDALFPDGDKHVYGYHHHPLYDPADPRVVVEIAQDAPLTEMSEPLRTVPS